MKKKNIYEVVFDMLKRYPQSQDSDQDLMARIWYKEFIAAGANEETARVFCKLFKDGKLTHPHSIRNHRQEIQRDDPSLRGKTYAERQKKSAKYKKQYFK
jgi:ribosomal protein L29